MSLNKLSLASAGAFERALAEAMTDDLPIPFQQILDPAQTPEEWLPFLAAHRSVKLWFSDWTVERKRQMVDEAIPLARLIGVREGARRFLEFVDAELRAGSAYPDGQIIEAMPLAAYPIEPSTFLANYLVEIQTSAPVGALIIGSEPIEATFLGEPNEQPLQRALIALRVAKAPETEIRVDFQNWRPLRAGDRVTAGARVPAGRQVRINRVGVNE